MIGYDEALLNELLLRIRRLGFELCRHVRKSFEIAGVDAMSAVAREGEDDTIYEIDRITEEFISDYFWKNIAGDIPCLLIAEGLPVSGVAFTPEGRSDSALFTVIMDPLDGTRGLMYGKRSAWMLAGIAPGVGALGLADIVAAVQTEVPPPKQEWADQMWATAGCGAYGVCRNIVTGHEKPLFPRPSRATSLEYGFVTFSRFFPGTKSLITDIETRLCKYLEEQGEKHFYFEDQYISSGGQLAELMLGRDRFVCDLRAVVAPLIVASGGEPPLCPHPYDLCTELIARESGVIVKGADGERLSAPLDTTTDVAWYGYANESIRAIVEDLLLLAVRDVTG